MKTRHESSAADVPVPREPHLDLTQCVSCEFNRPTRHGPERGGRPHQDKPGPIRDADVGRVRIGRPFHADASPERGRHVGHEDLAGSRGNVVARTGGVAGSDNESNRAFLARRLSLVDASARREYLDNLAARMDKAAAQGIDVVGVANAYVELKPTAISTKKDEDSERESNLRTYALVATAGCGLIALFTLVLVLLAIERNTRPPEPHPEGKRD